MTLPSLDDGAAVAPWLVLGGVLLAAWLAGFLVFAASTMPRRPDPGPQVLDLGPESPAVANLLVHRWRVTTAAASATLVDLAARGHLAIDHIGDGRLLLRTREVTAASAPGPLTAAEATVLAHVTSRAVRGEVPAEALLEGGSASWFAGFRRAVEDEATAAGLARPRWSRRAGIALAATLAVALLPFAIAFDLWEPDPGSAIEEPGRDWIPVLSGAALAAAGVVTLGGRRLRGLRHTAAGQQAAARWLGTEAWLRDQRTFEDLRADAVAVWDRTIAYACALGEAPVVAATFPMAPQPDDEAWSPATGLWREVAVQVPRRDGEGLAPGEASRAGLLVTLAGAAAWGVFLRFVAPIVWSFVGDALDRDAVWWMRLLVAALMLLFAAPAVAGTVMLLRWAPVLYRAIADGSSRTVVEGVVVKFPSRVARRTRNGEPQTILYTAVDDGTGDVVRALRFRDPSIPIYARVRVEVSPRLRHVSRVERLPDPPRRGAPLPPPGPPASAG